MMARGTRSSLHRLATVAYTPAPRRQHWIDRELAGRPLTFAGSVYEVFALLTATDPSPPLLVIDIENIAINDMSLLLAVREAGWRGTIITLGRAHQAMRKSLQIAHSLAFPLPEDSLRDTVAQVDDAPHLALTARLPIIANADTALTLPNAKHHARTERVPVVATPREAQLTRPAIRAARR
jgi:hypothetical protein